MNRRFFEKTGDGGGAKKPSLTFAVHCCGVFLVEKYSFQKNSDLVLFFLNRCDSVHIGTQNIRYDD